jgi:hypothetical protein
VAVGGLQTGAAATESAFLSASLGADTVSVGAALRLAALKRGDVIVVLTMPPLETKPLKSESFRASAAVGSSSGSSGSSSSGGDEIGGVGDEPLNTEPLSWAGDAGAALLLAACATTLGLRGAVGVVVGHGAAAAVAAGKAAAERASATGATLFANANDASVESETVPLLLSKPMPVFAFPTARKSSCAPSEIVHRDSGCGVIEATRRTMGAGVNEGAGMWRVFKCRAVRDTMQWVIWSGKGEGG